MRFNLQLTGLVHGILLLALIGRQMLQARVRGRVALYGKLGGLLLMGVGHAGVLAARLIKLAITRQREFLADAAAVQFTRNPGALVRVLLRVQAAASAAVVRSPQAEAVSHMFFACGVSSGVSGLLATHPPIAERIRRIDPRLSAAALTRLREEIAASREQAAFGAKERNPAAVGFDAAAGGEESPPDFDRLQFARRFLESLPASLARAAHEPEGAEALLYGLLLSPEAPVCRRQIAAIRAQAAPQVQRRLKGLLADIKAAGRESRLPLADLAGAAVRRLPSERRQRIAATVRTLAGADRRLSFWEYALQRVFLKQISGEGAPARSRRVLYRAIDQLKIEAVEILSMLAWQAQPQPLRAAEAFTQAAGMLDPGGRPLAILARDKIGLKQFDRALESFAAAAPALKRRLLGAAEVCLYADGRTTMERIALQRMLAAALDLPASVPLPLPAVGTPAADPGRDPAPAGTPGHRLGGQAA
jgi:hypothetical protein